MNNSSFADKYVVTPLDLEEVEEFNRRYNDDLFIKDFEAFLTKVDLANASIEEVKEEEISLDELAEAVGMDGQPNFFKDDPECPNRAFRHLDRQSRAYFSDLLGEWG